MGHDLKAALLGLPHVQDVWFDDNGDWYFSKTAVCTSHATRQELLPEPEEQAPEESTSESQQDAGEEPKSKKRK